MQKIKESKNSVNYITNRGYIFQFKCHYPRKNPPNALEQITRVLEYLGVFDGIVPKE